MESFNLKSSKFDVCLEGKLNLQYRHPAKGSVKVGTPYRCCSVDIVKEVKNFVFGLSLTFINVASAFFLRKDSRRVT
jgi:hypothetical protein